MQHKPLVILSCVFIFILLFGSIQPTSAQESPYSYEVTSTGSITPTLQWQITNVTNEVVEWGFGSSSFWHASANQLLTFDIHRMENYELHGIFTIGNFTISTNDSRIGAELAFSIWPWFPGLISHLNWSNVDQDATNAATGFMEGDLDIQTTSTTKAYTYQQGIFGNQNTTLVYDLQTGILLEGYTEFFFLKDYHLGVQFLGFRRALTNGFNLVIVFLIIITIIVIGNTSAWYRQREE